MPAMVLNCSPARWVELPKPTEAKFKAPPSRRAGSRPMLLTSVIALALLVLLALYMGRATSESAPRALSYVAIAFAVALVALRAIARRR